MHFYNHFNCSVSYNETSLLVKTHPEPSLPTMPCRNFAVMLYCWQFCRRCFILVQHGDPPDGPGGDQPGVGQLDARRGALHPLGQAASAPAQAAPEAFCSHRSVGRDTSGGFSPLLATFLKIIFRRFSSGRQSLCVVNRLSQCRKLF